MCVDDRKGQVVYGALIVHDRADTGFIQPGIPRGDHVGEFYSQRVALPLIDLFSSFQANVRPRSLA